jgi:hypothetical protein
MQLPPLSHAIEGQSEKQLNHFRAVISTDPLKRGNETGQTRARRVPFPTAHVCLSVVVLMVASRVPECTVLFGSVNAGVTGVFHGVTSGVCLCQG